MHIDRRTALLTLLSTGALGLVDTNLHAADRPSAHAPDLAPADGRRFLYALESGQRRHEPYALALVEYRDHAAHAAAFGRFRRSTGFKRRLAHRSSDGGKLAYAREVVNHCMTQPGIRFDILLRRQPMPKLSARARQAFIAEEYATLVDGFAPAAGVVLVTRPDLEPHRGNLLRSGLRNVALPASADGARADDDHMQAAGLIVGAIASSIAAKDAHGVKRQVIDELARACGTDRLTPGSLARTGKVRLHLL